MKNATKLRCDACGLAGGTRCRKRALCAVHTRTGAVLYYCSEHSKRAHDPRFVSQPARWRALYHGEASQ